MSDMQDAWNKLIEGAEPLQDITDRQRITAKLAEIERIARALVIADGRHNAVRPDHEEMRAIRKLESIRQEMLEVSEIIR